MTKRKLAKFAEIGNMPHVFQNFSWQHPQLINFEKKPIQLNNNWASTFFKNKQAITLELACGYGEYTTEMAFNQPNSNFIGIDIKGNRIHLGASICKQHNLNNVAFIRSEIALLPHFFAPNEIHEIWITFPDPQPNKINKRLVSPYFLNIYKQFTAPNAPIHLKTDNTELYEYALFTLNNLNYPIIYNYNNIDQQANFDKHPLLKISTRYEKIHRAKGETIKYIQFTLN